VGRNLRFSLPAGKPYSCLITDATNLVMHLVTNLVFVLFPLFEAAGESWPEPFGRSAVRDHEKPKSASSRYSRIALFLNAVLNYHPTRFNLRV